MDAGSTIGFVITDSGDIEGVFKNKARNKTHFAMNGVIPQAIAAGGTKLDCYGEGLVANYERYGFIPVARVAFNEEYANPGWDESKGRPDVYFMMHNGDSASTVVENIGKYEHMSMEDLEKLPLYDGDDGYDNAAAYRDSLLEDRRKFSKKDKKDATANNSFQESNSDIRRSVKDATQNQYDTSGTHWAIEQGIITKKDLAVFYQSIANLTKRGYYIPKTYYGEYVVESDNKMIFTNGDYNFPEIRRVVVFNDMYESNIAEYKGWIIDEARNSSGIGESIELIKDIEGEEYVREYSKELYERDAWETGERERGNRDADPDGTGSEKVTRYSMKDTVPGVKEYSDDYGTEIETKEQLKRAVSRESHRIETDAKMEIASETMKQTNSQIEEAISQDAERRVARPTPIRSRAQTEAESRARMNRQAKEELIRKVAATAKNQQRISDGVRAYKSEQKAEAEKKRVIQSKDHLLAEQKKRTARAEKQAELESAFRKDAEKKLRKTESDYVDAEVRAYKAEQKADENAKRMDAEHNAKVEKILKRYDHIKKKADLEKAFRLKSERELRDALRLNRRDAKKIASLNQQREAAMERMARQRTLDILRRSKDGKAAVDAINKWRKDGNILAQYVTPEDITTQILTLKEQAEMIALSEYGSEKSKKALEYLKSAKETLQYYFVSEIAPFEEFARLQSRIDSVDTKVKAYENRGSMTQSILTDGLRDRGGDIIDHRSFEDIIMVKNSKGKYDAEAQKLFNRYLYMMHSYDRMSVKSKAAKAVNDFLDRHPEYKEYYLMYQKANGELAEKNLAIRAIEIADMAKNGDAVAQEFIDLCKAWKDAKDKPVFGDGKGNYLGAETSKAIAEQIAEEHPWVVEKAEALYQWWDKFMRAWYVGGTGQGCSRPQKPRR